MRAKFISLLFCLFVGLNVCHAALPEGYTYVSDIATLQDGDRVVLYSTAISLAVTGWDGATDATVAAGGWAEYIVETTTGGVFLKDAAVGKYICNPSSTTFAYSETPMVCKLGTSGRFMCGSRYLCQSPITGGYAYRFYTSSTGSYKPFFLYKVPVVAPAIAAPTLSPADGAVAADGSFTAPFLLTMSCATEGAQIYYTIDGTDPVSSESRVLYLSPLSISETTVLRVIATDGTDSSEEVKVTYKLKKGYAESIAEYISEAPSTEYELRFSEAQQAIITAYNADMQQAYIQDHSGQGMIIRYYGSEVPEGATIVGNQLIGSLYGVLGMYENKPRMQSVRFDANMQTVAATRPEPIVVQSLDAATYASYPLMLVKIEDVTFSTNDKIVKDGVQYGYYDEFAVFTKRALPDDTVRCHITGIMTQFSGLAYKIIPVSSADIDTQGAVAELPSIVPFGGYTQEDAVTTDEVFIKLANQTSITVNDIPYTYSPSISIEEEYVSLTITALRDFYTSNTITLWYKPATPLITPIVQTTAEQSPFPCKKIVDNRFVIIGADKHMYNAQGMRIE